VVCLVAGIQVAAALGSGFHVLGAALLFLVGLAAVAVVIPVSKGAKSLVWSRVGDAFEWLAVALALPSALLYANALSLVRGMMAG